MAVLNPFITSGYAGAEYFCDRVQETHDLVHLLTNGNNLALISPRRLGKTDLMRHTFSQPEIRDNYYTFIIDIYATSSLADLVDKMGKAILDALKPMGRKAWEGFLSVLSSVRPGITYDQTGNPTWSLGLGTVLNPAITLDEIFAYLRSADRPCLVVIDEFQQITKYSDAAKVEAELRTYVQYCSNAHFVFSGSARHLMREIFNTSERPFYQSVTIVDLAPIPEPVYVAFCVEQFSKGGKLLAAGVAQEVYRRFEGVTYYMQKVMNILYMRTNRGEECTVEQVDAALEYILDFSNNTYEDLMYQLPDKQRTILVAIAREGKVTAITSADFVKRHHLVSASSVNSAVKALLDKDLITQVRGEYSVYDRFLELWLKKTQA